MNVTFNLYTVKFLLQTLTNIVGWGFANRNTRANKMKTFEMPVHPQKHCELIYHPHEGRMSTFDHKMMCAGRVLSRHKTCKVCFDCFISSRHKTWKVKIFYTYVLLSVVLLSKKVLFWTVTFKYVQDIQLSGRILSRHKPYKVKC